MRREQRRSRKHPTNSNTLLYISGGVLAVAVVSFIIAFVLYSNRLNENSSGIIGVEHLSSNYGNTIENTTVASSKIGKSINEAENVLEDTEGSKNNNAIKKENSAVTSNRTAKKSSQKKTVSTATLSKKEETTKQKDPTFTNPIEKGEVTKEYAKENLVYSDTLKEWVTHLGVDIKAEKATVVKAASEGVVKNIKNDPRYGLTIVIEHANGYKTVYANLLTTEFVSEGEKVEQGQTIGTVGDTGVYEVVDEPHLHFEILKDNENVNPTEYIKF